MRRRKVIIGILALLLCGVLAWMFWPEKPEPVYKGRKLSEWLDQSAAQGGFSDGVTEAIQAIGTNGIPFYLHWTSYHPGLLKQVQLKLASQNRNWLPTAWTPNDRFALRQQRAFAALGQLGERAVFAIPQLVASATNAADGGPRDRYVALLSMTLVEQMGRPGVTAILCLMTNDNYRVRSCAIIGAKGSRDLAVIARINGLTADPDPRVRRIATNLLQMMPTEWP